MNGIPRAALALAACLCASAALADEGFSNRQKVFPIGSEEYETISFLFINQGRALPSSAGPWSADELIRMLDKIDRSRLAQGAAEAYDRVAATFRGLPDIRLPGGFAAEIGMKASLEAYAHSNPAEFASEKDWIEGFGERQDFTKGTFETWTADFLYGYFELPLGLNSGNTISGVNNLYGPGLSMNVPTQAGTLKNIDLNFPYRAFFSLGGQHWNFQAGRDRLSWGSGESGNLMLGDNLRYHQFLKFAGFFDSFKFTSLASFFPHPGNTSPLMSAPVEGFKMYLAHRLEFRFLQDRLGATLNEAIMYQSATGTLDIRVLNPLGFYHNYYIRANANSMLGVELDFALLPGLNVYGQFAVDDFTFLEPPPPALASNPDAYGYILGVKGAFTLGPGLLSFGLEGAYTDPFFYLREKYDAGSGSYGVGYDVSLRVFNEGVEYLRDFIGYGYGNDAIVGELVFGYAMPGKWAVDVSALIMGHGVLDMDSLWGSYTGTETIPQTPSTQNPFDPAESGVMSTTLILGAKGRLHVLAGLEAYANINGVLIWNKGNAIKGLAADAQLTVGVSYSL